MGKRPVSTGMLFQKPILGVGAMGRAHAALAIGLGNAGDMPKEYEAIRDSLEKRGKPAKTAKRIAAATYNSRHTRGPFVTGHKSDEHPGTKLKGKHGY